MADDTSKKAAGPDLRSGIELASLRENQPLLGHFDDEAVVLVRQGDDVFATGATCTHYGGPLCDGLVVGETIRCPWHHARFSLRTGEAAGAPALNPVPCFTVRQQDGRVRLQGKAEVDFHVLLPRNPSSVAVLGDGAAGAACVDMLRGKGYSGPVTLICNGEPFPVDRPNLSKDFLAGTAPEDWIPLRTPEYYQSIHVELIADDPAIRIDTARYEIALKSGRTVGYGALLIATGAEPRSLSIPGAAAPHVHRLRTFADSKAIIAAAERSRYCVVVGASFIALEVAASLRQRGLEVALIARDSVPLRRVLGPELGRFVQKLHEEHGVRFILNATPKAISGDRIEFGNGESVRGDLVVLGVGVSPRTELAQRAGLKVDDGILVNESLLTSAPGIYAAGDVARYPDSITGKPARIEHWVVAERQGQAVARSMLGLGDAFRDAPFFWSQHYDVTISYVGNGSSWDDCEIRGDLEKRDACAIYRQDGRLVAVATIGRDRVSLAVEAALEQGDVARAESALRGQ